MKEIRLRTRYYSSNDKMVVRGISKRRNEYLREAIIESSWSLIRKEPAMLMKYNEYRARMNGNKAIVRIAKHLLSRIRFLWKNDQTYVRGIIESHHFVRLKGITQEL